MLQSLSTQQKRVRSKLEKLYHLSKAKYQTKVEQPNSNQNSKYHITAGIFLMIRLIHRFTSPFQLCQLQYSMVWQLAAAERKKKACKRTIGNAHLRMKVSISPKIPVTEV